MPANGMNDYLTISYHQFFHSNGNFGVSVSPNPHNKDDEHPLIHMSARVWWEFWAITVLGT